MKIKQINLMIGSPKGKKSSSQELGVNFTDYFKERGAGVTRYDIGSFEQMGAEEFFMLMNCDILVLSTPLYVNSLPAPVISLLENIQKWKQIHSSEAEQIIFLGIINSGFPEPEHCAAAVKILEIFANKSKFKYAGCMPIGAGSMIAKTGMKRIRATNVSAPISKYFDFMAQEIETNGMMPKGDIKGIYTSVIPEQRKEVVYQYINRMCD